MLPQYFLPVLTPDNRVVGTFAITSTTFTGNETSLNLTIGGVTSSYPVRRVTHTKHTHPRILVDFMAVDASLSQERQSWAPGSPRALDPFIGHYKWIGGGKFGNDMDDTPGQIEFLLRGGNITSAPSIVVPSAPSGSNVSVTYYANTPFDNAPACQFFEVNWQQLSGATTPERIRAVSIGAPSADPGNGNSLRAMVVVAPNVVGYQGQFTNVRVVRVTRSTVVSGTYTWPLTITDDLGQSSTLNVSVVVP